MNRTSSRPPVVVLLNRRRGSGSQSTLPARKPVQPETRLRPERELLNRRAA